MVKLGLGYGLVVLTINFYESNYLSMFWLQQRHWIYVMDKLLHPIVYLHVDVITYPCHNSDAGLADPY